MRHGSIIDQLTREFGETSPELQNRLLKQLEALPETMRSSPTARYDLVSRFVTEERLRRLLDEGVTQLGASAEKVAQKAAGYAEVRAAASYQETLGRLLEKAWRAMPINQAARAAARREMALMALVMFLFAFVAAYAAMGFGWLPHPDLTSVENRQLTWAKRVERSGNPAAVEWAARAVDDNIKLNEVQTALVSYESGENVRDELSRARECRGAGMQVFYPEAGRAICWFNLKGGPRLSRSGFAGGSR